MQTSSKIAIIIGSSGLIGTELKQLLINDSRYHKIKLLVRKPTNITHPKIEEVIINFDAPNHNDLIADEVFCCLGTTIKIAKTKEAFFKVDYEYVVSIASIAQSKGVKKFAVVSALGADKSSKIFYSKTKGQMEESVSLLSFDLCAILRPSMLLGKRQEFRLMEKIGAFFMTLFAILVPKKYKAISAKQVAKSMISVLNSKQVGTIIVENEQLLKIN